MRKIKIEFDTGQKQNLYFSQEEALESPPYADSALKIDDVALSSNVTYLEIVIDARRGIVIGIDVEVSDSISNQALTLSIVFIVALILSLSTPYIGYDDKMVACTLDWVTKYMEFHQGPLHKED